MNKQRAMLRNSVTGTVIMTPKNMGIVMTKYGEANSPSSRKPSSTNPRLVNAKIKLRTMMPKKTTIDVTDRLPFLHNRIENMMVPTKRQVQKIQLGTNSTNHFPVPILYDMSPSIFAATSPI